MQRCAFCNAATVEVLDFGSVALAGAFLKPEQFAAEKRYPLRLHFCAQCYMLQVPDRIDRRTLFDDYFYFTSATLTMREHFKRYAGEVVERFKPQSVLEIGCNDGALLKPLADLGVRAIGVDPARNVTDSINDQRVRVINDYFSPEIARSIGKVDVVLANNVFAHVDYIHGMTQAVSDSLGDDGVFIFEVNRLDSLIGQCQYDWIYHEHLFYYSLLALEKHLARHGLEIFDCKRLATHAGSMRYYAGRPGKRALALQVFRQRETERWMGLHTARRFIEFADKVDEHIKDFGALIRSKRARGLRVAGYGACGRTNTLLQACRLGATDIEYIVDDAQAKQGFYTPGTHIPIVSGERLAHDAPDCLIVFAWSFLQEIESKIGGYKGEVILPLPEIFMHRKALAV